MPRVHLEDPTPAFIGDIFDALPNLRAEFEREYNMKAHRKINKLKLVLACIIGGVSSTAYSIWNNATHHHFNWLAITLLVIQIMANFVSVAIVFNAYFYVESFFKPKTFEAAFAAVLKLDRKSSMHEAILAINNACKYLARIHFMSTFIECRDLWRCVENQNA